MMHSILHHLHMTQLWSKIIEGIPIGLPSTLTNSVRQTYHLKSQIFFPIGKTEQGNRRWVGGNWKDACTSKRQKKNKYIKPYIGEGGRIFSFCAGRECAAVQVFCQQHAKADSLPKAPPQNHPETGESQVPGPTDAMLWFLYEIIIMLYGWQRNSSPPTSPVVFTEKY